MVDTVIVEDTADALAERAAKDFGELAAASLAQHGRFSIALAGGVTPKQFYSRLAKDPYKSRIPWDKCWFFWGDERCVPKDHPDSNYRMAAESLLQYVPVPPSHVLRMRGEDPPPQAARDYEQFMRQFFRETPAWPIFDLVLLGLGPDGHTASLIPGTPAVTQHVDPEFQKERRQGEPGADPSSQPRWVVHNVVRALQTVRLTLTFPVINQARHIWFLVTGTKKAEAFAQVRKGPNPAWPASLVAPEHGELRWYIDRAVVSPPASPKAEGGGTEEAPVRRGIPEGPTPGGGPDRKRRFQDG